MKNHFIKISSLVVLLTAPELNAQVLHITVNGKGRDEVNQPISNLYIINRRTESGTFGNTNGSFSFQCFKNDTLMIGAIGFLPRFISFADSVQSAQYDFTVYLERKIQYLAQVEIFAPRDLDAIQSEIEKLGYNKDDYMLSGINAAQSPITFLYQQFSRTERSKRQVAEMKNEDRKRELLKELFRLYVDYEIIKLSDDEFDSFIDFVNVSDEFLKSSSQYDFLLYVKDRFNDYKIWKRNNAMDDGDFEYDKD